MNGIATLADVLSLEREHDLLPDSTYGMIGAAARAHPNAPALSFFPIKTRGCGWRWAMGIAG